MGISKWKQEELIISGMKEIQSLCSQHAKGSPSVHARFWFKFRTILSAIWTRVAVIGTIFKHETVLFWALEQLTISQ